MAAPKTTAAVEYRRTDDGAHAIGVVIAGEFRPFAELPQADANAIEAAEGADQEPSGEDDETEGEG